MMMPEQIGTVLEGIRRWLVLEPDAEVTLEANPQDVDAAKLRAWRQYGVNRLSMGVQTFDDAKLRAMGRRHNVEQNFLEQSHGEKAYPHGHVFVVEEIILCRRELGHHFLVIDDGAGDEVRENCHEFTVGQKSVVFRFPAIDIHEVSRLGEGEKGNPQGQNNLWHGNVAICNSVQRIEEEACVFEYTEEQHIARDAESQPPFAFFGFLYPLISVHTPYSAYSSSNLIDFIYVVVRLLLDIQLRTLLFSVLYTFIIS